MIAEERDEYTLLTDKLEELNSALSGQCNDIDCDKYIYRNLIRKSFKPVLEHNFSCVKSIKREKSAVMRLLSLRKFRKFRYKKCPVCRKQVDTLDHKSSIVAFTKPSVDHKDCYEWDSVWAHRACKKNLKIPSGWKKF